MKIYKRSLFIFRRDLRLYDNTGLLAAFEQSHEVIAAFIVDPRQIEEHPYRSLHALQFMHESLVDLAEQLAEQGGKLQLLHGKPEDVLVHLHAEHLFEALFFNKDYTPFSMRRDEAMRQACQRLKIKVHSYHDLLLCEPDSGLKKDGKPYTVFTPFYKKVLPLFVPVPVDCQQPKFFGGHCHGAIKAITDVVNLAQPSQARVCGGRNEGLLALRRVLKGQGAYEKTHDFPALSTTQLSPHNKFGTLSVREIYHAIAKTYGKGHALIRQLFWRDFFTLVAYHFPFVFGSAFNKQFDNIAWRNDQAALERWQSGQTGFPIIDAGMRQLNQTGWMHNRVRMIVASFLTKDLHIDWREGERFFAQKLVDYDPAVNNGNWQWAASTGCDAQPYFRIFNPWLQQKKFDPEAIYIKAWVPELRSLKAGQIHALGNDGAHAPTGYCRPMVEHAHAAAYAKALFKART